MDGHKQNTSLKADHSHNNSIADLSVTRGFNPNTACVEVVCEPILIRIEASFTAFNLSGLIPALTYDLVIHSLSNGTNLISKASDAIPFTTQPFSKH